MSEHPRAPLRIGVDVGGTFTDLMLADADGRVTTVKVPSVPADPGQGVLNAVAAVCDVAGLTPESLLAGCRLFVHGSTVATNTVLEGKGARVGMLTTAGFRDSLEIRRGIRQNPWDHRTPFPPVLVPRYLRRPVRGRIDKHGAEAEPMSRADIAEAARIFREEGVEAVAVCFLNSYANAAHERAAAYALREDWPWVTASAELVPTIGEYARGTTAVMNAYVAPRVVGYLKDLNSELRRRGLGHDILLSQSNGGIIPVGQVAARPVNLVLSGPAAGVGALRRCAHALDADDLISMEIGGTSCDVALMAGGEVAVGDSLEIAGYHLAVPSVEIHTVGAGGGTIAGVDGAGMLVCGPEGAGADPGPACYGRGGERPTVTDAHLVLGRLKPGAFAGGALSLDAARAENAIQTHVARPLGLSVAEAAAGILRLVEQHLLHAVERISVHRGVDPRRFTLVAAGGAGPLHGCAVARKLGMHHVYIPRQAGAFCAQGLLQSDIRQDDVRVVMRDLDAMEPAELDGGFAALAKEARAMLESEGFAPDAVGVERSLDLRYAGQQWDVQVNLAEDEAVDAAAIRRAFEQTYERLYGHVQPDGRIRVTALRVAGIGRLPPLAAPPGETAGAPPAERARRSVYLDDRDGWCETPVYAAADLCNGHELTGPLIVDADTTTVVAGAGDRLRVDAAGNFLIELAAEGRER